MHAHLHQTQGISEFSEFLGIQCLHENVRYLVGHWDILKLRHPHPQSSLESNGGGPRCVWTMHEK